MPKRKKIRKPYNTDLKKPVFNQNDRMFGKLKIVFLLSTVVFIGFLVISKINS